MADIAEGTESRQKAEYISHNADGKRGNSPYLEVTYKRLDGDKAGTTQTAGAFIASLDDASKNLIKAKGQFVIVKTKVGNFWNLTKVEDVSTFVEKPASTYTKKSYGSGGSSSGGSTYNTAGIKVGAVLHDAVALAGTGATVAKVKTIAEELLHLSYELEANVNAGKYAGTAIKPTVAHKAIKEPDSMCEKLTETTLDNIDF